MQELNTAEDFISFYGETMPFVQNLPLVLLHKELIFTKLISRLQMKARLSLEPILRCAILSLMKFYPLFLDKLGFVFVMCPLKQNGGQISCLLKETNIAMEAFLKAPQFDYLNFV